MRRCVEFVRSRSVWALFSVGLLVSAGCQTWRSAAVIPGLSSTSGERAILSQAKNDPFPSPSDVGMDAAK